MIFKLSGDELLDAVENLFGDAAKVEELLLQSCCQVQCFQSTLELCLQKDTHI